MNRTAFIMALTDQELADEITMYTAEMVEHQHNLDAWRGWDMLQDLLTERDQRQQAATLELLAA